MADKPLDLDFVRSFFPALNDSWAFMENAGGSLVCAQLRRPPGLPRGVGIVAARACGS